MTTHPPVDPDTQPTDQTEQPHEEVEGQQALFDLNEDGSLTPNPEALPDGVTA